MENIFHHSPLTISHHSTQFAIQIHNSPFTIHDSPFTVHIHDSPFTIHYMAFTVEKINEFFDQFQQNGLPNDLSFTDHPNCLVVTDYLTGKCDSLQGLTSGQMNWYLLSLASHIDDVDQGPENDQLLLDVLLHPDVYPYVQHGFQPLLIMNALNKNTARAISVADSILKNRG